MSEQVNPVPAEERESSSGLLLSVEPLEKGAKLYATDTVDGGADASGDSDTVDAGDADGTDLLSDSDGTDTSDSDGTDSMSDADGSDLTDKVKDALGMDSDKSDTVDADGTDAR